MTQTKAIQIAKEIVNNPREDYRLREMAVGALVGGGIGLLLSNLFEDDD